MEQSRLPSNSLTNQNKEKKEGVVKKTAVVSGKTKRKGKSFGEKLVDKLISSDVDNIKGYLVDDVLVPTAKKTFLNVLEILLCGKTRNSGGRSDIVSYNKMSGSRTYRYGSSDIAPRRVNKKTFDDIWFESRGDVEIVIDNLNGILEEYKIVSAADLYELAGQATDFTDHKYGWKDLSTLRVEHIDGGYVLKMPPPTPID